MSKVPLRANEVAARKRAIRAGATVARVTIGGFIRDLRFAAGLTQAQLADEVKDGTTQKTISQIETGKFSGGQKVLERVLRTLLAFKGTENAKITSTNIKNIGALYFAGGKMARL